MEMEVFQKLFYKGFGPIPGFVLDGVGHECWAPGLVGTLKATVKMRNTLHLDRTRLASAGPRGRGILRAQGGT